MNQLCAQTRCPSCSPGSRRSTRSPACRRRPVPRQPKPRTWCRSRPRTAVSGPGAPGQSHPHRLPITPPPAPGLTFTRLVRLRRRAAYPSRMSTGAQGSRNCTLARSVIGRRGWSGGDRLAASRCMRRHGRSTVSSATPVREDAVGRRTSAVHGLGGGRK